MIGAIIGAGLGVAGSLFGGMQASRAARKAKALVARQKEDNQNWFDRKYNEDPTQRAEAQRAVTILEQKLRDRKLERQGRNAVIGATEESLNAQTQQDNEAIANTIGKIHSSGEAQKANIENRYLSRKQQIDNALAGIENNRSQAITQAIGGLLGTAGNIALLGLGKNR